MNVIETQEWQALPDQAQQEVYDFFLFVKQQYLARKESDKEIHLYSNHSANLVKEWLDDSEDAVWT